MDRHSASRVSAALSIYNSARAPGTSSNVTLRCPTVACAVSVTARPGRTPDPEDLHRGRPQRLAVGQELPRRLRRSRAARPRLRRMDVPNPTRRPSPEPICGRLDLLHGVLWSRCSGSRQYLGARPNKEEARAKAEVLTNRHACRITEACRRMRPTSPRL